MKYPEKVSKHIVSWIDNYLNKSKMKGFVVGVSGGIDSALTSTLCAETGRNVLCIEMPINQGKDQVSRSKKHIEWLKKKYSNVSSMTISLDQTFDSFKDSIPKLNLQKMN
jgi:NAD+ synthase